MPRSHPRPVARGGRRALPVSPSHGARTAVSKWSPVGWGSLRPLPNGRQRHCRPSRGVVGAGVARGRASSPPVHLRSTRRAASAPRPGRGFRRGSEACIEGVHRDVHRVCSVRIGCVPKSEMGLRVLLRVFITHPRGRKRAHAVCTLQRPPPPDGFHQPQRSIC